MGDNPNLGFLFYKDYFKNEANEIDLKVDFGQKEKFIISQSLSCQEEYAIEKQSFLLKSVYPGTLIGSGYIHTAGSDDVFKLGFYFDHTSGLPVIPGSTVKGILKSAFAYPDYIRDILKECSDGNSEVPYDAFDIGKLAEEIFEGKQGDSGFRNQNSYMYDRDTFFDAILNIEQNHGKKILAADYITPHRRELRNPIPLKFIKVSPGIVFKFRFDLKPGSIGVYEKLYLFRRVLIDFGVGAKTNVGYGNFDELYGLDDLVKTYR